MAELGTVPKATFVLTGPRKGYSGQLGGRYWFKDGELTVLEEHKDKLKLVLCNSYCCNVKDEKPIWDTVEGASVKVGTITKPVVIVSTVVGEATASVVVPPVTPKVQAPVEVKATPKVEVKSD